MATHQAVLELEARELAARLAPELRDLRRKGRGFALLVFDYGASGATAYVSANRRSDLVRAMTSLVLGFASSDVRSAFDRESPS